MSSIECRWFEQFLFSSLQFVKIKSLIAPRADLLKKNEKEPLDYSKLTIECFQKFKIALSSEPILKIADTNQLFICRTDTTTSELVLHSFIKSMARPFLSRMRTGSSSRSTLMKEDFPVMTCPWSATSVLEAKKWWKKYRYINQIR